MNATTQRTGDRVCTRAWGDRTLKTKGIYSGAKRNIELLCDYGSDVEAFIESLDASDRKKLDVLFERMGEFGKITNPEKFKKLEDSDGVFEFKSFQIRILCFMAGARVVLCRGLYKKRNKHVPGDIQYVEGCRKKFLGE